MAISVPLTLQVFGTVPVAQIVPLVSACTTEIIAALLTKPAIKPIARRREKLDYGKDRLQPRSPGGVNPPPR